MPKPVRRLKTPLLAALLFLYGCAIAALVAFVLYGRQGVVEGTIDLNGFGAISRNIANGEGFTLGHGPTTRRGPLFPYLGGALLKLFGSGAPGLSDAIYFRPLLVANCVYVGLTCLVVWLLSERLFGARVGIVAALMSPLVPQSVRYVGMTEVETLMGLFTVLLAYAGLALVTKPSAKNGVLFGATAAAATLSKPIVLLYPIVFIPIACWHWRRTGKLNRSLVIVAGVTLASFGALLVPWTLRNMAVTDGQFKGISSNGPGEFLRGYINAQPKYFLLRQNFGGGGDGEKWDPEANDFEERLLAPFGIPFYRSARDAQGNAVLLPAPKAGASSAILELEKDRVESAEMKRRLLHEPGAFIYKFGVQLATFWYIVETKTKSLLVGAISLIMLTLAGIGVWRARDGSVPTWPVIIVVVYFNVIYAAFLAFARYSMPLFPTLTVLAAGGLTAIAGRAVRAWSAATPPQDATLV